MQPAAQSDSAPMKNPMRQHILLGTITHEPRILLRMALTLARLGFDILSYKTTPSATGDSRFRDVILVIEGDSKNLAHATRLLRRLVDVVDLQVGVGHGE